MSIDQILDSIHVLPDASKQTLKMHFSEVDFSKGHTLISSERVEKYIYFIKQGIVRAFVRTADSETTFWIGAEGEIAVSMKSFVSYQKGYEDIELLEDCSFFKLSIRMLHELFEQDIHLANWGRKLIEKALINAEERLISQQFLSATERYKKLLNMRSDLFQRVPLGYIASYLGITQVSLSRIRAEIK